MPPQKLQEVDAATRIQDRISETRNIFLELLRRTRMTPEERREDAAELAAKNEYYEQGIKRFAPGLVPRKSRPEDVKRVEAAEQKSMMLERENKQLKQQLKQLDKGKA